MSLPKLKYRSGYKYQVAESITIQTQITGFFAHNQFLLLLEDGTLFIRVGYPWDGPSGPAVDTPNFMLSSLVHDAFYQLMREELLPQSIRELADNEMSRINYEWGLDNPGKGMSWFRRWYTHLGVRIGASSAADPANRRKIIEV